MMNVRGFAVAAVFLVGCAVGGVSSQLVVPKASAQQAATLTKWEVFCAEVSIHNGSMSASMEERAAAAAKVGNRVGLEGWEPIGPDNSPHDSMSNLWCFKRPKM
jgi:hypothetical protein